MDDLMMANLPRWTGAIVADVIRWYRITGSWEMALTTVIIGLLTALNCLSGNCLH